MIESLSTPSHFLVSFNKDMGDLMSQREPLAGFWTVSPQFYPWSTITPDRSAVLG